MKPQWETRTSFLFGSITRTKKCNLCSIKEERIRMSGHVHLQPHVIRKPRFSVSIRRRSIKETRQQQNRCLLCIYYWVDIVGRPRPMAIVFVNVRRCICVNVVHNAAFRACKICRFVFNMNWSETCKCLLQSSFRDFVVATVATPGTNR